MTSWKYMAIAGALAIGAWSLPAFGADQARPGTVNYVEGAVYLDGQPLNNKQVGTMEMKAGQVLSTRQGKAEILLNPGIYLRVDDNSAVKMVSPDLTPTQVEVQRGRAGVEVDQLLKQNVVQVIDHGVTTQLLKDGYYEFDAQNPTVEVTRGKAEVKLDDGKVKKVKGGHQLALTSGEEAKFQPDPETDQLMDWSKLRSQYMAEANNQVASSYGDGYGYNPGWYWAPGWGYTFLGASPFYSPFGWGFYPYGWGYGGLGLGGGYFGPTVFYGRGFGYGHPHDFDDDRGVGGRFHGGMRVGRR